MHWELDRTGDGIVSSRLSSADVAKGETALGQVRTILDFCERQGLRPRWVTVSIRTTGSLDYEDRADIAFTRACIYQGTIRWAAWRDVDRLSRQTLSAQQYYRLLQDHGIDLYFVTHGGKVNWTDPSDQLMLTTLGAISEYERAAIKRRTHDGIRRRFLEEGRGWPNTQGAGFRRDSQKFVEVDPVQWPFIKRIHEDYLRLDPSGNAGLRPLAKHMAKLGFPLGRQRLGDILRDEVYVTGEWSVTTKEGVVYPCRRIEIPDPIARELFDRNQLVLNSNRSKARVNGPGHYLLNTVPVYHAACRGKSLPNGKAVMLKARQGKYRHTGIVHAGCKGMTIDAATLDTLVIEELVRLVESPQLQAEYRKRAAPTPRQNARQQLAHLDHRVRLIDGQRGELKRRWLEDGLAGGDLDPRYLAEAVGTLDQELVSLNRRRKILQHDASSRSTTHPDPNLLAAAREVLTAAPPADPDLRQRRLAFVQAAISEIVIRTHDDGTFDLEIVGALAAPEDVSELDLLQSHRCELSGSVRRSGQFAGRHERGDCVETWRSGWIERRGCVTEPGIKHGPRYSLEEVYDWFRRISAISPPGRIYGSRVEELMRSIGVETTYGRLLYALTQRGLLWGDGWRTALGQADALRLGRVGCRSIEDWRIVAGWAIGAGVSFDHHYQRGWDVWREQFPFIADHVALKHHERSLGFSMRALAKQIQAERDIEDPGWSGTRDQCRRAFLAADRALPLGRITYAAYDEWARGTRNQPRLLQLTWALKRQDLQFSAGFRLALGQQAVTHGRVRPETREEWISVVAVARDNGFTVSGSAWVEDWRAVRRRALPWLLHHDNVSASLRPHGGMRGIWMALEEQSSTATPPRIG
jgi:hypothetical protein